MRSPSASPRYEPERSATANLTARKRATCCGVRPVADQRSMAAETTESSCRWLSEVVTSPTGVSMSSLALITSSAAAPAGRDRKKLSKPSAGAEPKGSDACHGSKGVRDARKFAAAGIPPGEHTSAQLPGPTVPLPDVRVMRASAVALLFCDVSLAATAATSVEPPLYP